MAVASSGRSYTIEDIEKKADQIREDLGIISVPVDPVLIANKLGIKVNLAAFNEDDIAGMFVKRGANRSILVRHSDVPTRLRFTIAHEIGHDQLHFGEPSSDFIDVDADLYRIQGKSNRCETQANRFAAALLMPREEVKKRWINSKSVKELASLFQVSEEAMGYRLDALDLEK